MPSPRWKRLLTASLLACLAAGCPLAAGAGSVDPPSIRLVKHGEAFIIDGAIDFPVPLNIAWSVLTDFDHMAEILDDIDTSRIVSRSGDVLLVRQEGHKKIGPFSFSFWSEREVTLDPKKGVLSRQVKGDAKRYMSEMTLIETADGTSCRYHAELVPDSAIARIFGRQVVQDEVEQQFVAMTAEMLRRKMVSASLQ
jgi:hypothetical protein